jgi:NAD(P)-dependent dehydrogenase (short-subunit alcohol dehydrogenase family)
MKKAVLITGSSSGIGRAAAIAFSKAGWLVAATMRRPEKETELGLLPGVKVYALDVTDPATIDAAISQTREDFGRLDVVVNNAGYGVDGVFEAMDDDVIRRQYDTNVFGVMRVTRAAIPLMREQGGGTIVQISSMGGRITFPLYSIYHGTKWAVEGFTESLHYELRPFNIRLKLVEPGAIRTDFYGAGREFVQPPGSHPYEDFVKKVEKRSMKAAQDGASPEQVAQTILKAARDASPRMRYRVAYPATVMIPLRRLLPETWFFSVIRGAFKI